MPSHLTEQTSGARVAHLHHETVPVRARLQRNLVGVSGRRSRHERMHGPNANRVSRPRCSPRVMFANSSVPPIVVSPADQSPRSRTTQRTIPGRNTVVQARDAALRFRDRYVFSAASMAPDHCCELAAFISLMGWSAVRKRRYRRLDLSILDDQPLPLFLRDVAARGRPPQRDSQPGFPLPTRQTRPATPWRCCWVKQPRRHPGEDACLHACARQPA